MGDLHAKGLLSRRPYEQLRSWYERRLSVAEHGAATHASEDLVGEQLTEGLRRLADVERATLREALHANILSDHAADALERDIVSRMAELERAESGGEAELRRYLGPLLSGPPGEERAAPAVEASDPPLPGTD